MAKIAKDHVVALDYKLHLGDGKIIDQSEEGEPLLYLHGGGQIVPGLERQLEGLDAGHSGQFVVSPKEGYGEHDPRGVQVVPISSFPPGAEVKAGMEFLAEGPDGGAIPVNVKEVKGDRVVIDLNHPLAGKTLHFDITVRAVRKATAEELEHGHVHGEGGEHP
ncbi:MAG: peptidylprolyl isomerase [Myxococcaceae bacterium]|nr:peptidylprolyl isomerase [Myxococcaceae bacterium]